MEVGPGIQRRVVELSGNVVPSSPTPPLTWPVMWFSTTSAYTLTPAAWQAEIIDASWASVPKREFRRS